MINEHTPQQQQTAELRCDRATNDSYDKNNLSSVTWEKNTGYVVQKTASVEVNVRIGLYVKYFSKGPYISVVSDAIDERGHAAAAQQKYAVWWGDE